LKTTSNKLTQLNHGQCAETLLYSKTLHTGYKNVEQFKYKNASLGEDESNSGIKYGNRLLLSNGPTRKLLKNSSIWQKYCISCTLEDALTQESQCLF
jgi:hypothetical protein